VASIAARLGTILGASASADPTVRIPGNSSGGLKYLQHQTKSLPTMSIDKHRIAAVAALEALGFKYTSDRGLLPPISSGRDTIGGIRPARTASLWLRS